MSPTEPPPMDVRAEILRRRQLRKDNPKPPDRSYIDIPPPPPSIYDVADIPDEAVNLFPLRMSFQIFYLPSKNAILKVGQNLHMAEAEAMRFVRQHTSIPVPEVHDAYEKEGIGYIFMSKIEGELLGFVWDTLTEEKRSYVVSQLKGFVKELRAIRGDFYGKIGQFESEDIFFHHLCVLNREDQKYGPYYSRRGYNEGLVRALHNARPPGEYGEKDDALAQRFLALTNEEKVFSHGDLHLGNILADPEGRITGIIDWGGAGFSVPEREYLETKLRARDPSWKTALEEIFPEDAKTDFALLKELDDALKTYGGF